MGRFLTHHPSGFSHDVRQRAAIANRPTWIVEITSGEDKREVVIENCGLPGPP